MKILMVCQYFYPEQFRVSDICVELSKAGHDVTILTGLPNYPSGLVPDKYKWFKNRNEVYNGVKVIRSWLIGRGRGKLRLALNYISFAICATIKAVFLKKDFDVILVYQLSPITMALPGIFLKYLTNKPLVIYCHDLWPESIISAGILPKSNLYNVVSIMSKCIYKKADRIFTSSKLFKEYFNDALDVYCKINYLPVYAESLFEKINDIEKSDKTLNLVFAGNIGEMQSIDTIIYAANELKAEKEIRFHIVGDGSARRNCESLVAQLELSNVIFHGQYPITEMTRFYQLADAMIITLKANKIISYTLPNKVQSYMAAGKPIIGAIDGETQLVIKEAQCGLCCSAEDFKEFANIIKVFANNKNKLFYGNNSRKYYDNNFSKKIYIERLQHLLKEAVSGGI